MAGRPSHARVSPQGSTEPKREPAERVNDFDTAGFDIQAQVRSYIASLIGPWREQASERADHGSDSGRLNAGPVSWEAIKA